MPYPHLSTECGEHHDLVRDFSNGLPTIVVLCGSTRFSEAFQAANLERTLAGEIVLTIGCDMRSDSDLWTDPADRERIKTELDNLHLSKIDLADYVLVLNVPIEGHPDGYIGESTAREIAYAEAHGKPVRYLVEAARAAA